MKSRSSCVSMRTGSSPRWTATNAFATAGWNWVPTFRSISSSVKVSCSTQGVVETNPRFLLHVFRAGEWLGTVDGAMATGTVTSWRVVHVANREYLELVVGW